MSSPTTVKAARARRQGLAIIDCDVHPVAQATYPFKDAPERSNQIGALSDYLSPRWREHLTTVGVRTQGIILQVHGRRTGGARADAVPSNGGPPGSDPDFAREQLLDEFDIDAAILNGGAAVGGHDPIEFCHELTRANNDWHLDRWLNDDPRWYASIGIPVEEPEAAAKEIARCRERSTRFVQVIMSAGTERPIGSPHYWPIFEAAEHYDIPIAFHVANSCPYSRFTPSGMVTYYFEQSTGWIEGNFNIVPSLIFEGAFERFPTLKVVLVELGWAWAAPFAWRMDASWRVLRNEVPHLQRKPSEYLRDHFWYTTQPMEEPTNPKWFGPLYEQLDRFGAGDKLMFSTDYPHWNFDSPDEAFPTGLSRDTKRRIFSANASRLYNIQVKDDDG